MGYALLRRIGLWLAAFALLSQSLAAAAPPMAHPGDARAAAADLAALFGAGVYICADSDGQPAPAHGDRHEACPLCQVAANAAALDAPVLANLPERVLAVTARLEIPRGAGLLAPSARARAIARGPPSPT